MSTDRLFVWLAAVSAIVAAVMWLRAAFIQINMPDEDGRQGPKGADSDSGELEKLADLRSHLAAHSRWNSYAAMASSFSASCAAVAFLIP